MKIDNISHINALAQASLRNIPLKNRLVSGQSPTLSAIQQDNKALQQSQLSQLLGLLNLFPLIKRTELEQSPYATLMATLLKQMMMPSDPKLAATWLARKAPDKALLEALKRLDTSSPDAESNGKLKAMLMLLAEQRVNEQTKPGDHHWLFPFRDNLLSPLHLQVEKKTCKKRKKLRWCVTVNLTLSKSRHLTATAELEGNALALSFSTDSEGLCHQLEQAVPLLEEKLRQHHVVLARCDITPLDESTSETVSSGVDIQV